MLLSLHLKASMMKVSDPIIFGHVLKVFFKNFIEKNSTTLEKINVNFNSGLSNLFEKILENSKLYALASFFNCLIYVFIYLKVRVYHWLMKFHYF